MGRREAAVAAGASETSLQTIEEDADSGDFVYFDFELPPVHGAWIRRRGSGDAPGVVITLARGGVRVMLNNSTAPAMGALYEHRDEAKRAGLRSYRVPARRAINSDAAKRGNVDELVVTNLAQRQM